MTRWWRCLPNLLENSLQKLNALRQRVGISFGSRSANCISTLSAPARQARVIHTASARHSLEGCILSRFGDIDHTLSDPLQPHTVESVSRGVCGPGHEPTGVATHLGPPESTLRASNRGSVSRFGWPSIRSNFRSVACGRHYHLSHPEIV